MLKEQYKTFRSQLKRWYQKNARELPWRETKDPYKIWISEVMLQQTTVNAVIPYYQKWIQKYATIQDVAQESEQNLLNAWQGLGYYSRVRNIKKAAEIMIRDYQGKIPQDAEQLKLIPGFGPYTSGAVLSIAFNKRIPIVDANIRRVFMRILAIEDFSTTKYDKPIYALLEALLPRQGMSDFNQALMELGALVCRSREPMCLQCPVKSHCLAYQKGIQEVIPTIKKTNIQDVEASIGVIRCRKKYFIQKRSSKGLLAGLWEFPGGKLEPGESPLKALKRELQEEVSFPVSDYKFLFTVTHFYTRYRVKLNVFQGKTGRLTQDEEGKKWVSLKKLADYPMPSGSAKIVEYLNQHHIE